MGRTELTQVKQFVYDEFDKASEVLPTSYSGEIRATKGAALALRLVCLYMGDWEIAATAAKAVVDLGVYELHENYGDLFLPLTANSKESIF